MKGSGERRNSKYAIENGETLCRPLIPSGVWTSSERRSHAERGAAYGDVEYVGMLFFKAGLEPVRAELEDVLCWGAVNSFPDDDLEQM